MSPAIERLLAMSLAEGDSYDPDIRDGDTTVYKMRRPMSDAVRAAAEEDGSFAYALSTGKQDPDEGLLDEENDTLILFPIDPAMVAAAQAETKRGMTWQIGVAAIAVVAGAAQVFRALTATPVEPFRAGVGVLILVAAFLIFRKGRAKP